MWTSTGASTSVALSGLSTGWHYWQVRANNAVGTTYANGSHFYAFNVLAPPGIIYKISPANNAINQPATLTLRWTASTNAASYDYCINTVASCSAWTSTGANTSVTLTGLTPGLHYWQVRGNNVLGTTYANGGNLWAFSVIGGPPGIIYKSSPANNSVNQPAALTLSWTASAGALSYEYCINTTPTCSVWTSTGASTSAALTGLTPGLHYWQVRANNASGTTYANGGNLWTFSVSGGPPGLVYKVSPANNAINQPASLSLNWTASAGAVSYEYCINTTTSCLVWISTGSSTSAALSGLTPGLHYWQVRAINAFGTTYANGGNLWAFRSIP